MDATPRNNQQLRDATWNTKKDMKFDTPGMKASRGGGGFVLRHQQHFPLFENTAYSVKRAELPIKQRIVEAQENRVYVALLQSN